MRLSKKESDILACIELRGSIDIDRVRKETGYRDHTIRYHIKELQDRGVIRLVPVINIYLLGYTLHNVFFSLGSENKRVKAELTKAIINTKQVVWLAEMGGDFQYGLGMCARRIHEVQALLNAFSRRFGNIFFEKSVSSQFSGAFLGHKYLSSKRFDAAPLCYKQAQEMVEIDELDDRILKALSSTKLTSHRAVAQTIGVPLSTFDLRVRKLEERGVIAGYMYFVDSAKFGMQSFKLLIFGKGVNASLSERLLTFSRQHPAVVFFIECFGSWDYELGVEVESAEQVVDITQELYEAVGGDLNTVKILSHFRNVKLMNYPA